MNFERTSASVNDFLSITLEPTTDEVLRKACNAIGIVFYFNLGDFLPPRRLAVPSRLLKGAGNFQSVVGPHCLYRPFKRCENGSLQISEEVFSVAGARFPRSSRVAPGEVSKLCNRWIWKRNGRRSFEMIVDEALLPGPDAIERVTGHRPHYSQFFRWTQYGLRAKAGEAIRLEFVKAGSKRLTSEDAVRRFLTANTAAASNRHVRPDSGPRTPTQSSSLERRLRSEGL